MPEARDMTRFCDIASLRRSLAVVAFVLPAAAWAQAAPDPAIVLKLPRDLSPWGMFMAADIVVKAVMVGLAFASVLTWTIWFAKAIELMTARRRLRARNRRARRKRAALERGDRAPARAHATAWPR